MSPSPVSPEPRPINVLLVEDNPGDARLIIEQLRAVQGHLFTLERVDRLQAALRHFREPTVDVVLLDLGLPDSSGFETFLRARQEGPTKPIIVISGLNDEQVALSAVRSGAQDYLVKGRFEGELLARVIRYAIERQQIRQQAQSSEARLTAIMQAALDAHVTMDAAGQITSWNPQAEAVFGWPAGEVLGRPLAEVIIPPVHRDAHSGGLARFLATGEGPILNRRLELTALRRDGAELPVELTVTPVRLDDGWFFSGFIRDITERKRSEQHLQESERRFRELAENVREVFFVTDAATGQLLYTNPAYEVVFGHSREYAYSKPLTWMEVVHPEDRARMMAPRAVAQIAETTLETFRVVAPDGTVRWVRRSATPVKDASGSFGRVVGIAEDVTELKGAEERFYKAQKMEAVGRLAGGIAHDFNNLLVAIIGTADLLMDDLGPEDSRREDVEEIRKAGTRAADLTRQLLAFSRKQVLEPKVLEVNALVADLDKLLRRLIGEDVALKTVLAPGLAHVRADPGQLEQVIVNLAVNARDAMPNGGKLTIETSNADLDESYARAHEPVRPGRYVMIAVSDTGTGMSEETKGRIFEPFFTTKEQGKGTGLGLATVYGIVKQSEGYVWAYSEVGKGATFKIYLPQVDQPASPRERTPLEAARPRGTETILLVEDDEQVRESTRRMLTSLGYHVIVAEGGARAFALMDRHQGELHLLVTDVVMPKLSGRKVVEGLRQRRPGLKALYLSGYTDEAIVRNGVLEAGIPFLQKPFSVDALARKVREVLDTQVPTLP